MRRVLPVVIVLALVAAACVQPSSETSPPNASDPRGVSDAVLETIARACGRVVVALEAGDTATLISSLEDIDGALSASPDTAGLREYTAAAGDALPVFEDAAPSEEQLSLAAGPLIEISNALVSLGIEECAGIGEIAAGFTGPVVIDPAAAAKELAANRFRWEADGPDTYWMELSLGADGAEREFTCGWNGMIVVQVIDDRVVSAVDKFSGCTIDVEGGDDVPLTVEDLFSLVEESGEADMLEVNYEPIFGYPRMIFVDGGGVFYEVSVMSLTAGRADMSQADAVLAELDAQREIWNSAEISSYTMTVQIDCFCPEEFRGPFDVTVIDGEVATITWKGGPVSEMADRSLLTVDGLFERIESNANADSITVNYASPGYPLAIRIDPSRTTMDEELGVRVLDFAVGD